MDNNFISQLFTATSYSFIYYHHHRNNVGAILTEEGKTESGGMKISTILRLLPFYATL